MGYPQKIVTCCYCGTRAALVLKGKIRHELACSSCGAPLHDLKMLPMDRSGDRELVKVPKPARHAPQKKSYTRTSQPARNKKRRSFRFLREFAEEAFDFIEDIFD